MGFKFGNFVRTIRQSAKRFGGHVNRSFNVVKHHARRVLPWVKNTAGLIRDAAQEWSSLPAVGAVASQIGAISRSVYNAADIAEKVINATDRWQGSLGIDRSAR